MESVPYIIVSGLFQLIRVVLGLLVWAIIINAILSWLVAFDVINLRNRFVANVAHFLDAVTRPIMRPIQRIIPPLGGVDISPIIAILLIEYVFIRIILKAPRSAVRVVAGHTARIKQLELDGVDEAAVTRAFGSPPKV